LLLAVAPPIFSKLNRKLFRSLLIIGNREQGTGNREQRGEGIGNIGNRELGIGNREFMLKFLISLPITPSPHLPISLSPHLPITN